MPADFEQALVKVLVDDTDVGALVGTRISFGGLEVDVARPYISGQRINTEPSNTLNARDINTKALFDISCYADDVRGVYDLAAKIRAVLENFDATVVTTDGSVVISAIYWTDTQQFVPHIGSSAYRIAQFFSVWGEQT